MPLLSIWASNPTEVERFTIEQVVSTAGDGNLRDNTGCSAELRGYLSEAKSPKLAEYIAHCLSTSFVKGGMVLQDLVNELGRRLDFEVTNGRYQGTTNSIGFDGIWRSPEGHSVVVEVKTTDTYRISLDTVAEYREKLIKAEQIAPSSSILFVVGRQDTGDLEAQVRGSRHAWDIRLISADALLRLVSLKEGAEATETGKQIRSLLIPKEYTRLDEMIDVMFATAKDIENDSDSDVDEEDTAVTSEPVKVKGVWQFTKYPLLQAKRDAVIAALGRREDANLIKKTRALYWHSGKNVRAVCTISKRYDRNDPYWYAYHPDWDEFLGEGTRSFLVLGCMDRQEAFALPLKIVRSHLDALHRRENAENPYWYVHLHEDERGKLSLILPKQKSLLALDAFRLAI